MLSILTGALLMTYLFMRTFVTYQCTSPHLLDKFNAERYLGTWYELRRLKNDPNEDGECITAQYTLKDDGHIHVNNNQWAGWEDTDYEQGGAIGEAWISRWIPGQLWITFFADLGGRYRILETDYYSFAVIYACENSLANMFLFSEYSWVITRDNIQDGTPEFDAMMKKVDEIYAKEIPHFDHKELMRTT